MYTIHVLMQTAYEYSPIRLWLCNRRQWSRVSTHQSWIFGSEYLEEFLQDFARNSGLWTILCRQSVSLGVLGLYLGVEIALLCSNIPSEEGLDAGEYRGSSLVQVNSCAALLASCYLYSVWIACDRWGDNYRGSCKSSLRFHSHFIVSWSAQPSAAKPRCYVVSIVASEEFWNHGSFVYVYNVWMRTLPHSSTKFRMNTIAATWNFSGSCFLN